MRPLEIASSPGHTTAATAAQNRQARKSGGARHVEGDHHAEVFAKGSGCGHAIHAVSQWAALGSESLRKVIFVLHSRSRVEGEERCVLVHDVRLQGGCVQGTAQASVRGGTRPSPEGCPDSQAGPTAAGDPVFQLGPPNVLFRSHLDRSKCSRLRANPRVQCGIEFVRPGTSGHMAWRNRLFCLPGAYRATNCPTGRWAVLN